MRRLINKLLSPFGYRVLPVRQLDLVHHHNYVGGYEQYREIQIRHNQRKLERTWADEATLASIVKDLRAHGLGKTGICHGARNGFEVVWLREQLGGDIVGTDISETATRFPNMYTWDFHEHKPDREHHFDFVYTNSLDHAINPARALGTWTRQIVPRGRIYIEHTMAHSPHHASEMDPFGAHPIAMPYLFFVWGRGCYRLDAILELPSKQNNNMLACVFVLVRDDAPRDSTTE